MGKKVLTPSNSYMTKAGIFIVPETKEKYFNMIGEDLKNNVVDQESCSALYSLSQNYNWVNSLLNCNNVNRWWLLKTNDLLKCEGVKSITQATLSNTPISLLRIEKEFEYEAI